RAAGIARQRGGDRDPLRSRRPRLRPSDRDARREGPRLSATATESGLADCRSVTVVHGRGENAVTALADVDLTIRPGERIGLLGRSGSGKTTLLHVLGGLVEPSRGEVLLGGSALSSLDSAARGRARARSVA